MKRIVFVGGSHCGKTTLLEHYQAAGYPVIPEAAMFIMTQLKDELGLEQYRDWRSRNTQEFFNRVCEKQIELEQNAPVQSQILFLDRGVPDMIAISGYHGGTPSRHILDYPKTHRYDAVFLCELLDHFDDRPETGRMHTREDSRKIVELVYEEYHKYGYRPIRLGPSSVEERIRIIDQTLGL